MKPFEVYCDNYIGTGGWTVCVLSFYLSLKICPPFYIGISVKERNDICNTNCQSANSITCMGCLVEYLSYKKSDLFLVDLEKMMFPVICKME